MTIFRPRVRALAVVASTSLLLVACGNGGDGDGAAPDTDADISVVGQDNLTWDTETLEAEAGEISVALTCEGGVNHNFVIDETDEEVAECAPGETAEGTVELEPGEYTYVCTVPGHEQRMRGTLSVS
jgi:plastocyanin